MSIDYFWEPNPGMTPVVFAEHLISQKGRSEHGISFTPDLSEFIFGILDENGNSGKIFHSKKFNNTWTTPKIFEPLRNKSAYLPYFTPDGKSLLYAQSISDTNRLYITNIWKVDKNNGIWGSPKKVIEPISSISREANASMAYDGTLYFSSNRNCERKENCYTADLFCSRLVNNKYQNALELPELNSPVDEESIFISPNKTYLLYCKYTDDDTFFDLYISYRNSNENWTEPRILDATINSNDWDRRPFVSIDNKFLFFTRLQVGKKGLTESDIYWVNTSKVFTPFVYKPIADLTLQVGKKFELQIPIDYFKDIDDKKLNVSINKDDFNWLKFDRKKMKLSGLPIREGNFELVFTATDTYSNTNEDLIKILVKK